MDYIVSTTPTPLLKLPEDLSDWGLKVLPQSTGRLLVTDVSKVPEKVLCLLGDKRAVNAVRAAYKTLGTDAGEFMKGTGHTLSDLE
jgi:hypothetical protein